MPSGADGGWCEVRIASPRAAHAPTLSRSPGVTKVVVRDLSADVGSDDGAAAFELDRWRFRLPSCTRPAMATATYAEGELVVTVPKGAAPGEGDDGGDAAALLGGASADSVLVFV